MSTRWTEEEEKKLAFFWGTRSLRELAEQFDRTPYAVSEKARSMELGPMGRGTLSLREFVRITGYSESAIRTAMRRLGINLVRARGSEPKQKNRVERYAIDIDAQETVISFLAAHGERPLHRDLPGAKRTTLGRWGVGRKPERCDICGTTERPHYAKGKCKPCYMQPYLQRSKGKS